VCRHCELPAETNARTCPVCGARYEPTLRERLTQRFGRA
jgi:rubrerythrin